MKSDKKQSETELFRQAMADVKPLRPANRIEPDPRRPAAAARQQDLDDRQVLRELLSLDRLEEHETGEELLFLKPGYQQRILRRLRRGHYSVADTIDLHHMDVKTARQVLLDFIDHSLGRRQSCVRVIHGKGLRSRDLPQLKLMCGRILRKHPRVIAFASCRPVDGGTGATDVLLSARPGSAA
ncbi:MAG: Smr/MutS family endonuclease [Xanthomonadales bacterium]|jgi:DNA-nicking Smr family endonuclease|nr:Smr/MutS family endonuclease [Xanthomonadales bacterium]